MVYRSFKDAVVSASQNNLNLYIDIHQNGRQTNLEVATWGISKAEAWLIKKTYGNVRDRVLKLAPEVTPVELLIEPLDSIEIGAWAAKARESWVCPRRVYTSNCLSIIRLAPKRHEEPMRTYSRFL
jgi:hypothetical protein